VRWFHASVVRVRCGEWFTSARQHHARALVYAHGVGVAAVHSK